MICYNYIRKEKGKNKNKNLTKKIIKSIDNKNILVIIIIEIKERKKLWKTNLTKNKQKSLTS